jgi:hypothetical protein
LSPLPVLLDTLVSFQMADPTWESKAVGDKLELLWETRNSESVRTSSTCLNTFIAKDKNDSPKVSKIEVLFLSFSIAMESMFLERAESFALNWFEFILSKFSLSRDRDEERNISVVILFDAQPAKIEIAFSTDPTFL